MDNKCKQYYFYLFLGFCLFTSVIYLSSLQSRSTKSFSPTEKIKETAIVQKPNFILILTDDQDSVLGSMDIMESVQKYIVSVGITFSNSFVSSPLCCPSRSSILSGQYVHNHRAINNSLNGGCSNAEWQNGPEKKSFVNILHQNGYQTFFAGKYLNRYGMEDSGGLSHVPPGWDWWIGLRGNSKYYNYVLSVNGTAEEHGNDPEKDYLTNVIKCKSLEFLNIVSQNRPFFMMLSTPACHAPFEPEPKYMSNFSNFHVPRTKNFNIVNNASKHWLMRLGEQPLNDKIVDKLDDIYRMRLRTLLSVDDIVKDIVSYLKEKKLLDSTYIIFTSDNGYHLGQFSLPLDKREPYEFDIRVPFFIRGPHISPSLIDYPVTNIDIAPTVLDLAGITIPRHFDGISFKPILESIELSINTTIPPKPVTYSFPFYFGSLSQSINPLTSFRKTVLIEHSGEGRDINEGCEYLGPNLAGCKPEFSCKCEDSKNNTYACLRHFSLEENFLYCSWKDRENFEEFYDLSKDLDQLHNFVSYLPPDRHKKLKYSLNNLKKCHGARCAKLSQFVF